MARDLSPRGRWLLWGAFTGALYGAAYAWPLCWMMGEDVERAASAISGGLGGIVGAIVAARYYAARPTETNLCTWLGMLIGAIPALGILVTVAGPGSKGALVGLAAFAFLPIMSGLFIGGFLDRISEGFLFSDDSSDGRGP